MRTYITAVTTVLSLTIGVVPAAGQARQAAPAPPSGMPGPFELLVEHRAALGLTDTQVAQIEAIRREVEASNRPLVSRLVGMRREMAPRRAPREMSQRERAQFRSRIRVARPYLERIRENNEAAMLRVREVLSEEQRAALRRLVRQRRPEGIAPRADPPGARAPGA